MITKRTYSDSETYGVGASLASFIKERGIKNIFIALSGDLGAGKTVFTRGFVSVASPESRVKSPTYTIVNEYLKGDVPVYHFDFYRIEDADELFGIGFDDYLFGGLCIAEWCEKIAEDMPASYVKVTIEKSGECERDVTIDFSNSKELCNVDFRL